MKKQWIALIALLVMVSLALVGCGGKTDNNAKALDGDQKKPLRVALILPSPKNDGGWSTTAYDALMALEKNYGVEVAYTESVKNTDAEEIIRGYAVQGYDWIISHSFTYGDIVKGIAPDFPNIYFTVNSTDIFQAPNVSSFNYTKTQTGFIAGVVAALITETNKVAGIGGKEIPSIIDYLEGFAKGAKYINPDIEVTTILTGNFDDPAQAKETAMAFIDRGVDVLTADADTASLGVIQASQERGIYHIGVNADQNSIAPNTVVTSALKRMTVAMDYIYNQIIDGKFEAKFYSLGVKEGAVALAPYYGFEDKLPQEVKDKINEILDDLANNKIDLANLPK
ncbi:MAG: BMP family protein [Bacillota bacterium]